MTNSITADLGCRWIEYHFLRSGSICFSTVSCIFTSDSICKLKMKCSHVLFPGIMEESGSRLVFSHLSVLWEGKEKDEVPWHLLSVGWASANEEWALWQILSQQSTAESNSSCIESIWLKDMISAIRSKLLIPVRVLSLHPLISQKKSSWLLCHIFRQCWRKG